MKQGLRQSMAWLHTWTGLLVGWVLLLIFMGGTASYYRQEISRWMRPELPTTHVDTATALRSAERYLKTHASDAQSWNITLSTARNPVVSMYWLKPAPPPGKQVSFSDRYGQATVDPATGKDVAARDTMGGEFFYRLHFDLHYIPVILARYIVGFCAMFMLVAIISGVITHKKIFKDFFTFRPGKGQRSWLDFHNVSAVLALPYHAMITYTGIVTLMFMYLPWGVKAAYGPEQAQFFPEAYNRVSDSRPAAGVPAHLLPLDTFAQRARADWHGADIGAVAVNHPGDANASVAVTRQNDQDLSARAPSILFDGVDGHEITRTGPSGGATRTGGVMYGLHMAEFAGPLLRLLFFGSGLLGCLMVASGLVMWAAKERRKHEKDPGFHVGLWLVDALNIGCVAGLPIAFAAFFWGNRLLPVELADRAEAEVSVFFIAWGCALLAAFVHPRRRMWVAQLSIAAAAFGLIPVLNALTTHIHLGVTLPAGDWALAGVDLVCLGLGLALGVVAWRVQRWQPPLPATAKRRAPARAQTPVVASAPGQS